MRRRKKKAGDSQEVDLTPMLDVVFIMLIFFIVTASFVKEKGLDLNRPSKNQQQQPDDSKKSIVINITDRNQVWIQKRPVDVRSVKANVARLLAENPGAGVVIRVVRSAAAMTPTARSPAPPAAFARSSSSPSTTTFFTG